MVDTRSAPIRTHGFSLASWQLDAVEAWWQGDAHGPRRGTLEIFTGGGKTMIALACIERLSLELPQLRAAIVVPTEALARQWRRVLEAFTTLQAREIGTLGAGRRDELIAHRVLISVLNTASKRLPASAAQAQPLLLIVDECHRAGAPTFSQVLRTTSVASLGLSATPDREELDDDGEPLTYDAQLVGRALGSTVYSFGLREARLAGWLPDYQIHHHGITLDEDERRRYEAISRKVDDAADRLRQAGVDTSRARSVAARQDELGKVAQAWVSATSMRKDLLYRARERERIATRLVQDAFARPKTPRVLLFHERVDEAVRLFERLQAEHVAATLEHSRLPDHERVRALQAFRTGDQPVLVSVKSLVEGLDVPDADVGVSVASSSSVRQRIQSLGRVLRRNFDASGERKRAEMHILYVRDTVDESIYGKEDWADLTGEDANSYWVWSLHGSDPQRQDGPPRQPKPTEAQEWIRLGERPPSAPVPWLGVLPFSEYSVDTRGNVTNAAGSLISNPQSVAEMVASVRGRPGGRFRVTPVHRLVIVLKETEGGLTPFAAGALEEPFAVRQDRGPTHVDEANLVPGHTYAGPATKVHGTYAVRQKLGGVIERRLRGETTEFAVTGSDSDLARNASDLLAAWRRVSTAGLRFHLNELWHAWYLEGGEPRFLAKVPGGFEWPGVEGGEADAVSR